MIVQMQARNKATLQKLKYSEYNKLYKLDMDEYARFENRLANE